MRDFLSRHLFSPLQGMTAGAWASLLARNRFAVAPTFWPRAAFQSAIVPFNSALARLEDTRHGRAVAAISEERLCRMKMANGMPRQAIAAVLETAGIRPQDIHLVAVAQKSLAFQPEPTPWDGWFEETPEQENGLFYRASSTLAPVAGRIPLAWQAHHTLKGFFARDRYILPEQIARVDAEGIQLNVTRDALIKRPH